MYAINYSLLMKDNSKLFMYTYSILYVYFPRTSNNVPRTLAQLEGIVFSLSNVISSFWFCVCPFLVLLLTVLSFLFVPFVLREHSSLFLRTPKIKHFVVHITIIYYELHRSPNSVHLRYH